MTVALSQPVYPPSPGKAVEAAWGDAVAEQVIQHFVDIADRNAKWTAPIPTGSMCVTTSPSLNAWIYDGTQWLPFGGVLIGEMKIWPSTVVPANWLICDGRAVSRTTYQNLFTILGSGAIWGAGDGSTTFNLPDMRGRAPIGVGQGTGLSNRALAAKNGVETVALTAAQMPQHNHTIDHGHSASGSGTADAQGSHMHTFSNNPSPGLSDGVMLHTAGTSTWNILQGTGGLILNMTYTLQPQIIDPAGSHSHNIGVSVTVNPLSGGVSGLAGSSGAHENMQPSIGVNYIIFAGA